MRSQGKAPEYYLYFRRGINFRAFLKKKVLTQYVSARGVYFGEEFCEHLIPSAKEVMAVSEEVLRRGWDFYLVTGIMAPNTLRAYLKLLKHLDAMKGRIGVVFNDWGFLQVLRREYPNLDPVMGRMLFKNKRYIYNSAIPDGFSNRDSRDRITRNQLKAMRETNLGIPAYKEFLQTLGVRKIDIDIPPQGLVLRGCAEFNLGVYFPWGYLTSGRTCPLWASGRRFVAFRPCRVKACIRKKDLKDGGAFNTRLMEIGNTVFYEVRKTGEEKIRRWIYEVDMDFQIDVSGLLKFMQANGPWVE